MKKILPLIICLFFTSTVIAQETTVTQSPPPSPVSPAPDSISITAIPPRLELQALPGATLQETIKVTNDSEQEMAFKVLATDFIVNDDKGTPVAVSETVSGRWSLASWLTPEPNKVLLKPNQTASIDLIVTLPEDALPGGHYAMITYQPVVEGTLQESGSGSAIIQKVGTLIYLQVVGDISEAANLKQFSVNRFQQYGPVDVLAQIENLSDIHIRPTGLLTIKNMLNRPVFNQPLETFNIFPFASRTYQFTFPGKWHFGRYQAVFQATAGETQIPINGLIYFWILPYKEISVIVLVLLVIIVLIKLKNKPKKPTWSEPPIVSEETPEITPPQTTA